MRKTQCGYKTYRPLVFAVLLGTQSLLATLATAEEGVQWSGFFTTGVAASNRSTPYERGVTKQASIIEETTFGLNLASVVTPTTTVSALLVSRGSQADGAIKADWVFATYKPAEPIMLTLGKQKMPIWMVSGYADVGTAYPWAHPPEEVYSLLNLNSFTGASLRYDLSLGDATLTFIPYGGEVEVEARPSAPTEDTKLEAENMFGARTALVWGGTTLRVSYNRARWNLGLGEIADLGQRRIELLSYGLMTKLAGMTVLGEYATTRDLDEKKYLDKADDLEVEAAEAAAAGDTEGAVAAQTRALFYRVRLGGGKAYYLTTGRHFGPTSAHLTYASLKRPVTDDVHVDQRSVALTLGYDPTPSSIVKLEAKRLMIPDDSNGLFKSSGLTAEDGLDGAMIYTMNYSLVF